jgi:cystathionine beta-lyase/cystathionine gamma-synthase
MFLYFCILKKSEFILKLQKGMNIKPKTTPIYQTSVFTFDDLNELEAYFEQPTQSYFYSRMGNPNSDELAAEVCKLEGGAGAVATSSGMAAILTAILTYCQAGDHILCAEEIYGGSVALITKELSRMDISVTYVPMENIYQLQDYSKDNTRLLLTETISNPLIKVLDLHKLAEICRQLNMKLVVDNTFASPILTKPLELGADISVHSVTKYLSGHSDVTAGVVIAANAEDAARTNQIVITWGLNLSPMESWLAVRGLKTLRLRIKQHSANALEVAKYLHQHPKVKKVYYPGLETHADHALAAMQGNKLYGGMLSFCLQDDTDTVNKFMQALKHIPFAPSLAGVRTSISYPLKTSHRALTPEQQQKLGISIGLIRFSAGIEETEELIVDLQQALDQI